MRRVASRLRRLEARVTRLEKKFDAVRPALDVPANEDATPILLPEKELLHSDDLIAAWQDYQRDGDGHFNQHGMQNVLDQKGIEATVSSGDRIGAGDAVLLVETPDENRVVHVLPSFNKSPRSVANWFDDHSDGSLTGRVQRLTRLARGRWADTGGFELSERGEVA